MASKKYLTAQVSPDFFALVKVRLAQKRMSMRSAIIEALGMYLDIEICDREKELAGISGEEDSEFDVKVSV